MARLRYRPEQAGYVVRNGSTAWVEHVVEGGLPRTRQETLESEIFVEVQWYCNWLKFSYLQDFHDSNAALDYESFTIPLILDNADFVLGVARFVPGTWKYNVIGKAYTVTAVIAVSAQLPYSEETPEQRTLYLISDTYPFLSYRVSEPYFVYAYDAMDISHGMGDGILFDETLNLDVESVDISHAVTGGTILDALIDYVIDIEAVDISHAVTGGTILNVLLRYDDAVVEAVDISHSVTGGTVEQVLYTYTEYAVEAVDISHAVTGGTIT